jgi:hypothetical protein
MEIDELRANLETAQGQIRALNLTLLAVIQGLPRLACAQGALALAIEVETHERAASEEGLSPRTAATSLATLTGYRDLLNASGR